MNDYYYICSECGAIYEECEEVCESCNCEDIEEREKERINLDDYLRMEYGQGWAGILCDMASDGKEEDETDEKRAELEEECEEWCEENNKYFTGE